MQIEGTLSWREIRCVERPVRILRVNQFDLATPLRERGRDDAEASTHCFQVRPRDVDEDVSSLRSQLRQDSVDDGWETQDLTLGVRDDREDGLRGDEVRVLSPLLMLHEDVQQVHLFGQT